MDSNNPIKTQHRYYDDYDTAIKANYNQIDNACKFDNKLHQELMGKKNEFMSQQSKIIMNCFFTVLAWWALGLLGLSLSIYFLFDFQCYFIPLLIAILFVTPIAFYVLHSKVEDRIYKIIDFHTKETAETERCVTASYSKLFYNNIREWLAIPYNVTFDKQNLPNDYLDSYTRYISPYGSKIHKEKECSGATVPIHVFKIPNYTRSMSCSKCNRDDDMCPQPDWFKYYLKMVNISKEYHIPINRKK